VLVALTLLAVVILLVTRAFLVVLSVTSQGGRLTTATALAAKQLETIRAQVEAQPSRVAWRTAFCNIAAVGRTTFAVPYGAYEYQVFIDGTAVSATAGQEPALLPCWSAGWDWGGCPGAPGYQSGNCINDANDAQDDRLRWVTVEVFYRGAAQPVARMTTAVIRGAYH
jgi:hypothetical protein